MRVPQGYHIIFDTNSLCEGNPIRISTVEFVKRFAADKRFSITFLLPEVVQKEIVKNVLFRVKQAKDTHNNSVELLNIYGNHTNEKETIADIKIIEKVEQQLTAIGFGVIETPYEKIDMRELIEKAVFYKPPFQAKGEKGFKDSVIGITIAEHIASVGKGIKTVIITQDQLFRSFLIEEQKSNPNVEIFASVPEVENMLLLKALNDDDKFIELVSAEARDEFYSLYAREEIQTKIFLDYHRYIVAPDINSVADTGFGYLLGSYGGTIGGREELWTAKSPGDYSIGNPIFIKKDNEQDLFWSNTVLYKQTFVNADQTRTAEYTAEFSVEWMCKLEKNGKLDTSKIVEIKYVGSRAIVGSFYSGVGGGGHGGSMYSPSLIGSSGASLAGQGTVPVTGIPSISKSMSYSVSPSPSSEDDE